MTVPETPQQRTTQTTTTAPPPTNPLAHIPPFETLFAVPLHCDACITDIRTLLTPLPGIHSIEGILPSSLIRITGNAPPSAIVSALQSSGRDAILRGTGKPNSAAVCILETPVDQHGNSPDYVRGLARIVQVAPRLSIFDLSVRGLKEGRYAARVAGSGDVSSVRAAGETWEGEGGRGEIGEVEVGKDGRGSSLLTKEVEVWEIVGRAMVLSPVGAGPKEKERDSVLGVIARSAGVWENEKTVCSCNGKTLWEERKEALEKGLV